MKKISSVLISLTLALVYIPSGNAETLETRPYEIQKGDTLWDISGKEYGDSFQWPMIWKENPEIKNPDRIYPGQEIKVPAGLIKQKEIGLTPVEEALEPAPPAAQVPEAPPPAPPAPDQIAAPETEPIIPRDKDYLFTKDEMIASGFITKEVPKVGKVDSYVSPRQLVTFGDEIYIDLSGPVKPGDKFLVIEASRVRHPRTSKNMGYLVHPLGIVEVLSADNLIRAQIVKSYDHIVKGATLIEYTEPEPPMWDEGGGKPDVTGYILALEQKKDVASQLEFLYLDKGAKDNLKVGDLLVSMKGPDENATVQIIRTEEDTSTAIVRKQNAQVNPGDKIRGSK